jgi:DNA modification methylase
VLDAFCGCGTTLAACEKLKRKWIGIDLSPAACSLAAERMAGSCNVRVHVEKSRD